MAYVMTKQGSQDNVLTYEFMCDKAADLESIEKRYRTLGSIAIVVGGDDGLEVYIAGSDRSWVPMGASTAIDPSAQGSGLSLHICGQDEVDNGLPDIDEPDDTTIYLVAASEETNNLYDEYIYVDGEWEKFGGGSVNLSGIGHVELIDTFDVELLPDWVASTAYAAGAQVRIVDANENITGYKCITANEDAEFTASKWHEMSYAPAQGAAHTIYIAKDTQEIWYWNGTSYYKATDTTKAPINNPVFTGSISLGRKANTTIGDCSVAIGYNSEATSGGSIAIGSVCKAYGGNSLALGNDCTTTSSNAVATGNQAKASNYDTHAEGASTRAIGYASHAEGGGNSDEAMSYQIYSQYDRTQSNNKRNVPQSLPESVVPGSYGDYSHVEGRYTHAHGASSHAEGYQNYVNSSGGHVEGQYNFVSGGNGAHAEGTYTYAYGDGSHAEGKYSAAMGTNGVHAEGTYTYATGQCGIHAEGYGTYASGAYGNHAEGYFTRSENEYGAHAEGMNTHAYGGGSHAEGYYTYARGGSSHAEGTNSSDNNVTYTGKYYNPESGQITSFTQSIQPQALGLGSHCEGNATYAQSDYSHAEGQKSWASGIAAHAEGKETYTWGVGAHAEGETTYAGQKAAHCEGIGTISTGIASHAEGNNTVAMGSYSHVGGQYNVLDEIDANIPEWQEYTEYHVGDKVKYLDEDLYMYQIYVCTEDHESYYDPEYDGYWNKIETLNYAEIIGNGTADNARSNARALDWSGNEYLKGDLYVGCNADSTGGTKVTPLPAPPVSDGTYTLQCTVSSGVATYSWVSTT